MLGPHDVAQGKARRGHIAFAKIQNVTKKESGLIQNPKWSSGEHELVVLGVAQRKFELGIAETAGFGQEQPEMANPTARVVCSLRPCRHYLAVCHICEWHGPEWFAFHATRLALPRRFQYGWSLGGARSADTPASQLACLLSP